MSGAILTRAACGGPPAVDGHISDRLRLLGIVSPEQLPTVRTYFRSTTQAKPEQLDEIEVALAEIHARHADPKNTTDTKGGTTP